MAKSFSKEKPLEAKGGMQSKKLQYMWPDE